MAGDSEASDPIRNRFRHRASYLQLSLCPVAALPTGSSTNNWSTHHHLHSDGACIPPCVIEASRSIVVSCVLAPAANHDAFSDPPSFLSTVPTPAHTSHFRFHLGFPTCQINKAKRWNNDQGCLINVEQQKRATIVMVQPT